MEPPIKILGRLVSLDVTKRRFTVEVDFFDPEKQEILETLLREQKQFSFSFWKPFRQTGTYSQLKKYYKLIHKLLEKLVVPATSEAVKAIDDEVKRRVFPCDNLELYGRSLPMLPSKSTMSLEDRSKMIQFLYDNYGVLLEDDLEIV